jgi:hypothetical protein
MIQHHHRPIHTELISLRLIGLKPFHSIGNRGNGIDIRGKFGYFKFGYLQQVGAVIFTESIRISVSLAD